MSRDPLDILREADPVSAEDVPSPPMALAERIMGTPRRSPRRALPGWALAAVAAALVMVVGGTALWLARPASDPGFADGGTVAPSDTTQVPPDTTVPPSGWVDVEAVAYFFAEHTGSGWRGGPFLIPVAVAVQTRDGDDAGTAAGIAHGALGRLFDLDSLYGFSSAIPPDADYLGLEYDEETGVVTVFVSAEFAEGGGTFSMHGRLAQVVYTATAVDGVSGVRFEVDGEPTTVFGGDGVVVGDPATRDEFEAFLPGILIESPAYGGSAGNPLVASGTADAYEATVLAELRDRDGAVLWEGFTTATCGSGCRGDWEIEIPYEVGRPQWGALSVWEESAEDGSVLNLRMHTVWLVPVGTGTATPAIPPMDCSARDWMTPLTNQHGLPEAVAETRRAIWAAATTCDWEALLGLMGGEFSYSFAFPAEGSVEAIYYWQDGEAGGGAPMLYLAELLNRPYRSVDYETGRFYVWPSAFQSWETLPEAEREALRPLYGDEDFASFDDFHGYLGYRIGIDEDGTWRFFIAGD